MFDPNKDCTEWSLYSPGSATFSPDSVGIAEAIAINITPVPSIDMPSGEGSFTDLDNYQHNAHSQESTLSVKEELKKKIRKRRRLSGVSELPESDEPNITTNVLSPADIVRKERRKASNRRAAIKCRQKKREEHEDLKNTFELLQQENETLKQSVTHLTGELEKAQSIIKEHEKHCGLTVKEINSPTNIDLLENFSFEDIERILNG